MSIEVKESDVDRFLSGVMEIEEQPKFMHGSNKTARQEKLLKFLEEFSESP
jgi:hypothetical protein